MRLSSHAATCFVALKVGIAAGGRVIVCRMQDTYNRRFLHNKGLLSLHGKVITH
jgi:hypothetical protein